MSGAVHSYIILINSKKMSESEQKIINEITFRVVFFVFRRSPTPSKFAQIFIYLTKFRKLRVIFGT